jgi:gamma-glutamylcyclotransferase
MMYYFAYASNLSKQQMSTFCPGARPLFTAVLPNYKLVFTGWSRTYRGGLATVKPFRGEKVRGAVYEVDDACLRKLDRWESGYARFNITVFDEDNQAIQAVTYLKSGQLDETLPSREYAEIIKQGYRDWRLI